MVKVMELAVRYLLVCRSMINQPFAAVPLLHVSFVRIRVNPRATISRRSHFCTTRGLSPAEGPSALFASEFDAVT
jgi:hypothetical protein